MRRADNEEVGLSRVITAGVGLGRVVGGERAQYLIEKGGDRTETAPSATTADGTSSTADSLESIHQSPDPQSELLPERRRNRQPRLDIRHAQRCRHVGSRSEGKLHDVIQAVIEASGDPGFVEENGAGHQWGKDPSGESGRKCTVQPRAISLCLLAWQTDTVGETRSGRRKIAVTKITVAQNVISRIGVY